MIDTCARFCAFFGTAHEGRLAYAAGYTGLGVGASRFGGNVMLDLLSGEHTERTALSMVRRKPLPFPPEPARSAVIQLTRAVAGPRRPQRRPPRPVAAHPGPARARLRLVTATQRGKVWAGRHGRAIPAVYAANRGKAYL